MQAWITETGVGAGGQSGADLEKTAPAVRPSPRPGDSERQQFVYII
jgi:hypothetical protein